MAEGGDTGSVTDEGDCAAPGPLPAAFAELYAEAGALRHVAFGAIRRAETPGPGELAATSGLDVVEVEELLGRMGEAGLVRRDRRGAVVGIAGLSVEPTAHRLVLIGAPSLFTWCALDAIGIPAALGLDAEVVTRCWHCGRPIELFLPEGETPDNLGFRLWLPPAACSNVFEQFCSEANLFCDADHLAAWRAAKGDPAGQELDLASVGRIGRASWAEFADAASHLGPRTDL